MASSVIASMTAELENICRRLAELDTRPVTEQMSGTIQDGDVTLSFNDYRAALVAQRAQLLKDIGAARAVVQGPFTITTGTVKG